MVKLRLKRCGKKQRAVYRIVAKGCSTPKRGKISSESGSYKELNLFQYSCYSFISLTRGA
uniref:30S ribosomal protein S16, chloroplastic n=1 Tax=Vigna unguiculata TaxID=3917 RepID=A0A1C7D459_VIGUN|nr:ribosomal protein S16 [Vigna unguiculata]